MTDRARVVVVMLAVFGWATAAEPAEAELSVATPAAVGLDAAPLEALRAAVAAGRFPRTTSVLVVKDGRLVFEEYFEGGGREILNDTRSAMKSVTSLAVGAAIADGKLASVAAPAFALLGDLAPFAHDGPLKQGITLQDLLTMSSALECNDWDDASPGNEENMYPLQKWARWAVDLPTKVGYERDREGRGPFSYCTAGVFLLGQILQRATGEPVDRYVEGRVLSPLGITRVEWPRSPSGEVMTGGGLRLRSRDLAKLAVLLLDRGEWQGRRLLPKAWLDEALSVKRRVDESQEYGYLFWRRDYEAAGGHVSGWFMSGNGGNVVAVVPERNLAVVVTRVHYNSPGMHPQTVELIEEHVLAALGSHVRQRLPVAAGRVPAFAVDRDEVTWARLHACVFTGACRPPDVGACRYADGSRPTDADWSVLRRGDHPAVCVDFPGAVAYCRFAGGRVPTEAEWVAAAGGADGRAFPWGSEWNPRAANWGDPDGSVDGYVLTAPPGRFPSGASPVGARDMVGNVWEWTERDPGLDPPADAGRQAIRGGGFAAAPQAQRISKRAPYDPVRGYPNVGFRCVYPAP